VKFWVNKARRIEHAQLKRKMMQRKKKYLKQKDDANDNKNEQTLVSSKYKFTYIMGFASAK
jgi:hypothetical protein